MRVWCNYSLLFCNIKEHRSRNRRNCKLFQKVCWVLTIFRNSFTNVLRGTGGSTVKIVYLGSSQSQPDWTEIRRGSRMDGPIYDIMMRTSIKGRNRGCHCSTTACVLQPHKSQCPFKSQSRCYRRKIPHFSLALPRTNNQWWVRKKQIRI